MNSNLRIGSVDRMQSHYNVFFLIINQILQDGRLTVDEIVDNHFVFVGSKATISGTMLHDEF